MLLELYLLILLFIFSISQINKIKILFLLHNRLLNFLSINFLLLLNNGTQNDLLFI